MKMFGLDKLPEVSVLAMESYMDHKPDFYALSQPTDTLTEVKVLSVFNQ